MTVVHGGQSRINSCVLPFAHEGQLQMDNTRAQRAENKAEDKAAQAMQMAHSQICVLICLSDCACCSFRLAVRRAELHRSEPRLLRLSVPAAR